MNRNPDQPQFSQPDLLPIAVRVYPLLTEDEKSPRRWWPLPEEIIVFDTETRTDATQRLTFGSYRVFIDRRFLEEGLFYGNDLSTEEMRTLRRYVRTHQPNTASGGVNELRLLSLRDFLEELFKDAYKARCLLVAFNHPFDLSRISSKFTSARGRYVGGFSLTLWTYLDKNGHERRNQYRPEIRIKHIDAKRALIGFTRRKKPDQDDLIPEAQRPESP